MTENVNEQLWEDFKIDKHGDFSIISGNFRKSTKKCFGVRWNIGQNGSGYPTIEGKPAWFLLPDSFAKILDNLKNDTDNNAKLGGENPENRSNDLGSAENLIDYMWN